MIPGGNRMTMLCFVKINVDSVRHYLYLVMLGKVKYFKQWIHDNGSVGIAGQSFRYIWIVV